METADLDNTIKQRPNRHIQNVPLNSNRIHVFPKHKWGIFQDRHMSGQKTTVSKCKKTEILPNIFFLTTMVCNWKSIRDGKLENSQICGS